MMYEYAKRQQPGSFFLPGLLLFFQCIFKTEYPVIRVILYPLYSLRIENIFPFKT